MGRILAGVLLVIASITPTRAQPSSADLKAAFDSLERAASADEWGRLVTDDAVVIHADGEMHTKRREMEEIRKATGAGVVKVRKEEVHLYGTTAIRRFELSSGTIESQVWLQQDGKWRMAMSQQTAPKK